METVVRGEHSVVTGLKQTHIASVVGPLRERGDERAADGVLQVAEQGPDARVRADARARAGEAVGLPRGPRSGDAEAMGGGAGLCYERLFDAKEQQKEPRSCWWRRRT